MKPKYNCTCQLENFNWLQSFVLREKLKIITKLNMICIFRERRNVLTRSAVKIHFSHLSSLLLF
jgi:hypothetical protein